MHEDPAEFRAFVAEMRRTGFHACVDFVARQMLPALIFPKVYREFLRQECDAAHAANTPEGRLLLEWVGWKPEYYLGSRSSDDKAIDGPLGPQQLIRRFVMPLGEAFPDRRGEFATRVIRKILDSFGVPTERDEAEARRAMLADAEQQFALPVPSAEYACNPVVRALADITAAELGVLIPWDETSASGLGLESDNFTPGLMRMDGLVVVPRIFQHDITDRAAFAGDMIEFLCWLPCCGATHVPVTEFFDGAARRYLSVRPHLHDRALAVVSSLHAIQLQWSEAQIARVESALKGRRLPHQTRSTAEHISVLAGIAQGRSERSPLGGWSSVPAQELAWREIRTRCQERNTDPQRAAREILEIYLLRAAMIRSDWEVLLDEENLEDRAGIVAAVKRRLDDPSGVEVEPVIAALVEAEGLPSFGRLRQPGWTRTLCAEALRQYQDAESAFVDRVNWQPTPRVPDPPKGWATILSGYARAVESELLFSFFEPVLARFEVDKGGWSDEALQAIRDGAEAGRQSIGSQFARFILSRRRSGSVDEARSPCLGDMHFLLSCRPAHMSEDQGARLMTQFRLAVIGNRWDLGVRRNVAILEGINRYRVDSAHARRADSAREVARDQALLGRRIMVHYLQFLVELKSE